MKGALQGAKALFINYQPKEPTMSQEKPETNAVSPPNRYKTGSMKAKCFERFLKGGDTETLIRDMRALGASGNTASSWLSSFRAFARGGIRTADSQRTEIARINQPCAEPLASADAQSTKVGSPRPRHEQFVLLNMEEIRALYDAGLGEVDDPDTIREFLAARKAKPEGDIE